MIRNIIFNTTPTFFHAPGAVGQSPLWPRVLEHEGSLGPQHVEDYTKTYTIITWQGGTSGYWNDKNPYLLLSLERLGIMPLILAREIEDWKNTCKITTLVHALEMITTPYFILADLTDVSVMGDPMNAVKLLQRSTADMIYSAEDYFWPPEMLELRADELSVPGADMTPYSFLNAGLSVGKTDACKDLFRDALMLIDDLTALPRDAKRRWNEQPIIKKLYTRHYPRVQLDFRCEVFQVTTRQTAGELYIP